MKCAIFTILAKNYLAYGRALMESVAQHAPSVERFVVLVDEIEGCFDPSQEAFTVLYSKDLPIPDIRWFHFKYTVLELSTAVKPYAAQFLLEEYGFDRLIYLDPDILLYHSPDVLFRELDDAEILLTPHLTVPIDDEYRPDELDILRSGAYNLGFVGLRRSAETSTMLRWWQRRLFDRCVVSPEQGLFVDQRWIDLAPGLFSGVKVVRDPGWNVAYWNIQSRQISMAAAAPTVDGRPLVFFHFSGFDPFRPEEFSKHQNRYSTRQLGEAARLVDAYRAMLLRHGVSESRNWRYTWSRFRDGSPIPDITRPVHHEDPGIVALVDDPFSDEGREAFAAVWNRTVLDQQGRPTLLTRTALRIYSVRADVREAMPDVFGADADRFHEWFITTGSREHGVPAFLVDPVRDRIASERADSDNEGALHSTRAIQGDGVSHAWMSALISSLPGLADRFSAQQDTAAFRTPEMLADMERYLVDTSDDSGWTIAPPRIADLILAARPDVRSHCFRSGQLNETWYFAWLLTYGQREYRLPRAVMDAIKRSWSQLLRSKSLLTASRARLERRLMQFTSRRAAPGDRPPLHHHLRSVEDHPAARPRPKSLVSSNGAGPAAREGREFGVNLIGYIRAEMGVGESARLAHLALEAAGVPVAVRGLSTNGFHSERDCRVGETSTLPYIFDLIHANADQFESVVTSGLGSLHHPKFTIGYWAWELGEFPEHFHNAFRFCGEVWTPSEFCRKAMELRSPVPVVSVPHPIRPNVDIVYGRQYFSIDRDRFVFLCMADMLSVPVRKNPLGVIDAFLRAAPRMPGAELIVKIANSRHDRAFLDQISAAAKGPVRILDTQMTRVEVDSLINCADCFVSLHRSEGFGLPMAEAMAMGKPVVATAYSGNMDFMDQQTAFLVEFELGRVPLGCDPYRPGAVWAEPSMTHAAAQMIAVYSEPEIRANVAASGQLRVKKQLDPSMVGQRILARLKAIERRHQQ